MCDSYYLESNLSSDIIAGPSGFEPETAGFLSNDKSPVLYLAELRAHSMWVPSA